MPKPEFVILDRLQAYPEYILVYNMRGHDRGGKKKGREAGRERNRMAATVEQGQ